MHLSRKFFIVLSCIAIFTIGCREPIPSEFADVEKDFVRRLNRYQPTLEKALPERKLELISLDAYCEGQKDESLREEVPLVANLEIRYRGQDMETDKFNRIVVKYNYSANNKAWSVAKIDQIRDINKAMDDGKHIFEAILKVPPKRGEIDETDS